MSEDSWDADDFDVEKGFVEEGEQWEGEDEDLDLAEVKEPVPDQKKEAKPTKTKEDRIAEKKAKRRAAELEAEVAKETTPVLSQQEEKEKKEKLQHESDLRIAMETFGVSGGNKGGIEAMDPSSEEEFSKFKDALSEKISKYETSPHYVRFMEQLLIKCCGGLDTSDLRHLSTVLSTMATEKQKAKTVKGSKKKGVKASLGARAVGKGAKRLDDIDYDNDLGAEFDDFM